jgi:hypothetical protein
MTSHSVQFLPLTTATYFQLKGIIHYETKEVSLAITKINGVMQASLSNGSLLRTSSFPNGFFVGQSDTIQFATFFGDKNLKNVKDDTIPTNPNKTKPISNIVTINAVLKNTG